MDGFANSGFAPRAATMSILGEWFANSCANKLHAGITIVEVMEEERILRKTAFFARVSISGLSVVVFFYRIFSLTCARFLYRS